MSSANPTSASTDAIPPLAANAPPSPTAPAPMIEFAKLTVVPIIAMRSALPRGTTAMEEEERRRRSSPSSGSSAHSDV